MIIPNAENGSQYTVCKGKNPQNCPICGRQEVEGSISIVLNDWGCNASVCKSCWDSGFNETYAKASSQSPRNSTVESLTEKKQFHERERRRFMEEAVESYHNYLKTLAVEGRGR
jgi:ribosome-binding protein aMBF1 (putative translation factor)